MSGEAAFAYRADGSLKGKLRRRYVRLLERKPARFALDRPLLSISFDDAPASAVRDGAKRVEDAGARATYYISAGLCGREGPMGLNAAEDEIRNLSKRGHEIGCHSFSHLDCGQARAGEIERDVQLNYERLAEIAVRRPRTFAYPYGDVSRDAKRVAAIKFRAARALHSGLVEDGCDLNQLPAVGVEGRGGELKASRWMNRAAAKRAWLILYTHDVSEDPSDWGCTPGAIERLLNQAKELGFEIATVANALDRIGA
ncbi:MAG TPA: polysaccharide deacetylase family protein [Caulobacteraceae bacterium]|jgi:peptidoglycan/xylan/chitin deacetylase (PgdA/CDA1 family)|nr:polysaccharide deacetylase family protein [Caulobacteraceae bacterium]